MIEKTLDVTELPVAKTVQDGDQLLLVRPNGDGTKTAMRIEGAALKQTKVKKVQEQYVIGHAVKPRACDQGHMVNWYVFGTINDGGQFIAIIPIQGKYIYDHFVFVEKFYIKSEFDSEDSYREIELSEQSISPNGQLCIYRVLINYENISLNKEKSPLVIGIRVDKYEVGLDGRFLAVWLTWRSVPKNIKTASTHHWFEGGYRQYRPIDGDRQFLAKNIDFDSRSFSDFFSDLKYKAIICKKMCHWNSPGEGKRNDDWGYLKRLIFKRLRFSPVEVSSIGQYSHAKNVGGLYRAIPIYSICKTKGRPVYFYVRKIVRKLSNGKIITKRCIEWK